MFLCFAETFLLKEFQRSKSCIVYHCVIFSENNMQFIGIGYRA